MLSNINRWRGQLGLPDLAPDALETAVTRLRFGDRSADFIDLLGTARGQQTATYVVIFPRDDGQAWFVKLQGSAALALRERDSFMKFCQSLRF